MSLLRHIYQNRRSVLQALLALTCFIAFIVLSTPGCAADLTEDPDHSEAFMAMVDQANPEPCEECAVDPPTFAWPNGFDSSDLECERTFNPQEETEVNLRTSQALNNKNYEFGWYDSCLIDWHYTICESTSGDHKHGTVIAVAYEPYNYFCPLGAELELDPERKSGTALAMQDSSSMDLSLCQDHYRFERGAFLNVMNVKVRHNSGHGRDHDWYHYQGDVCPIQPGETFCTIYDLDEGELAQVIESGQSSSCPAGTLFNYYLPHHYAERVPDPE